MSSASMMNDWGEDVCLSQLETLCSDNDYQVSSDMMFRFACFHNFSYECAKSAIETSADNKYLNIRMSQDLAAQFESRLLFPLPKLTLKRDNSHVIYIHPSRYQKHSAKNEDMMVKSLCYVLNDFSKSEAECRDGVAVVINMNGWSTESSFNKDVWFRVMRVLQGELVPTKVKTVLIVDAPKEFVGMWNSGKRSLLTSFSKNVHLIKESKLGAFLMEDYEEQMPCDFVGTWRCPNEIVEDYVDLKSYHDQ